MAHCQAVTCFPRPVPWAPSVSVMLIILLVSIVLNQMVHMSEVGRYTSLVAVNTGLRIQRCRTPQIGISWIRFSSIFFPEEIHHAKLWHLNTFVIRAAARRRCRARARHRDLKTAPKLCNDCSCNKCKCTYDVCTRKYGEGGSYQWWVYAGAMLLWKLDNNWHISPSSLIYIRGKAVMSHSSFSVWKAYCWEMWE